MGRTERLASRRLAQPGVCADTPRPGTPRSGEPARGRNSYSPGAVRGEIRLRGSKFSRKHSCARLVLDCNQYSQSTNETVEYRFKTAMAGLGVDGAISPFTYGSTGPDGAQVFACGTHIKLDLATTQPADGFFVIELRLPLDVTAVYSSADNAFMPQSLSLHVNKIDARAIPNLCQKDLDIDISSPAMWKRPTGALISQVPAANVSALGWDATRTWLSYSPAGNSVQGQSYVYQLNFCSCSSQGGTLNGDVKSDDASTGLLNPPATGPSPIFAVPNSTAPPVAMNQSFQGGGNGSIVATVQNPTNPTGISFTGTLNLSYGHAGRCR